jgi:hypothetical protein
MKTNHDGTITLNADIWTSCNACGQRVTVDSIHTCSPQTLTNEEIEDFTVKVYNCRTGAEAHAIVLAILRKAQKK